MAGLTRLYEVKFFRTLSVEAENEVEAGEKAKLIWEDLILEEEEFEMEVE